MEILEYGKKILSVIPIFALLVTLGFNQDTFAFASNEAQTQYAPETSNDGEISTKAIKIENGFIGCMPYGSRTDCNWNIRVKGDTFVHNGVHINIQKNHGWLNGGWKDYTTYKYNYAISESASITTLRNTRTFSLPKGEYRARLGGTFILLKSGKYIPIGHGWANFTVK